MDGGQPRSGCNRTHGHDQHRDDGKKQTTHSGRDRGTPERHLPKISHQTGSPYVVIDVQ